MPAYPVAPRARTSHRYELTPGIRVIGAALLAAVLLAGCGGDGSDDSSAATGDTLPAATPVTDPPASSDPSQPSDSSDPSTGTDRVLLIDLDGATYNAVQSGIAAGKLPNLAQLNVRLAYSGGMVGTPSQQPTLDMPGWATLLTGTWGARHQVISNAPEQALHAATLFQTLKSDNGALNGAAVASGGMAQLLNADHEAGYLDTLADCSGVSGSTDCVTAKAAGLIGGGYRTVLAQYRAAKDAALDYGLNAPQYTATLVQLDQAIGTLVSATAKQGKDHWLVLVTGNHGLAAGGQDDGLPLLPEMTTFLGMNQAANAGAQAGAATPAAVDELYGAASIADVAPTALGYLKALAVDKDYALDGGSMLGTPAAGRLTTTIVNNNSADVEVVLNWTAPAAATFSVIRDGQVIASNLPAGTATFTDNQLSQELTAQGTYQLNYTVESSDGESTAARAVLTSPLSYVPPVPLAASLTDGLVSYYPFGTTLPPVDALGHSVMAPAAADLPASAGIVQAGPLPGTQALLIDTNFVDTNGFEGYKITPATGFDIAQGTTPQFTIGFWFKTPTCIAASDVPVFGNKNYVSGSNAGVQIGLFSSATAGQCGIAYNIGSGGARADGPTSPYTQIAVNRWVYIAFSVDGVAKTMNMYMFDPVTLTTTRVAIGKSTGTVNVANISPFPQWGVGEDGTGRYLMNKCSLSPPYTAGQCATAPTYQQLFGDLALWNRVLTDAELQSIFLSNKPLSTLLARGGEGHDADR